MNLARRILLVVKGAASRPDEIDSEHYLLMQAAIRKGQRRLAARRARQKLRTTTPRYNARSR